MCPHRRTRRFRLAALAAAVLALLLPGCRVTVDVGVDLEADGSGVLRVATAADAEARARVAEAAGGPGGADPLDGLAAVGEALAVQGWRVTDMTGPGGTRSVVLATDFADPAELEALTRDLADALAATEARPLEPLVVRLTDDRVLVTGSAAIEPTAAVADAGFTPEQVVDLLAERDALGYTVAVTFPGEVLRADGARVREQTAVWEVAPGERVDIRAEAVRPQPVWPYVAGGAAATLLLGAAVAVLLRRRRRRPPPAPEGPPQRRRR